MDDQEVYRVRFDSTVGELADVNMQLTTRTQAFRSYRARAFRLTVAFLTVVILAGVYSRGGQQDRVFSITAWAIVGGLSVLFSAGLAYGYNRYLDWTMRRQYKRILSEQLGGIAGFPCEIELRRGGVWVLQNGIEMTFSWANAVGVEDAGDAIELRFNPGLVVVRNRAFHDERERSRFLERARELAPISKVRAG